MTSAKHSLRTWPADLHLEHRCGNCTPPAFRKRSAFASCSRTLSNLSSFLLMTVSIAVRWFCRMENLSNRYLLAPFPSVAMITSGELKWWAHFLLCMKRNGSVGFVTPSSMYVSLITGGNGRMFDLVFGSRFCLGLHPYMAAMTACCNLTLSHFTLRPSLSAITATNLSMTARETRWSQTLYSIRLSYHMLKGSVMFWVA